MEWLHLPAEIWFHVFSFLPHKRFPRRQLSLVNWRFNEIVQNIPLCKCIACVPPFFVTTERLRFWKVKSAIVDIFLVEG